MEAYFRTCEVTLFMQPQLIFGVAIKAVVFFIFLHTLYIHEAFRPDGCSLRGGIFVYIKTVMKDHFNTSLILKAYMSV